MRSAFDQALAMSEEAARDPVAAVRHARTLPQLLRAARGEGLGALPSPGGAGAPSTSDARLAAVLERLTDIASESGRMLGALGVTHIVRVDGVPVLTQAAPESGSLRVEWPGGEGLVRSVFAGTVDGAQETLSRISVRIATNNGSDELFTTGTAAAYVPLVAFQARDHNWLRLADTTVSSLQRWSVSFNYEGALGGPAQVRPFLLFGFVRK